MSPILIAAAAGLVVAQLALPKHWAFLPLIIAGCHIGNREILPELTTARLLIFIGLFRATTSGFIVWPAPRKSPLDTVFIIFSICALLSSFGHKADEYMPSPFSARAGLVLNIFGTYMYGRSYLPDLHSFKRYAFVLPLVLIPLAVGMAVENRTAHNVYYALGARGEIAMQREGRIRAQGPFQHPILAGCAGGTALAFVVLAWRQGRKKNAMLGIGGCLGVVLACASSGPLATVAVSFFGIGFWVLRNYLKHFLWSMAGIGLFYYVVKGKGPWYLMASIDLVGGSTGWHRAKLIDQGLTYLSEWWLWGTDYTRHWMSSGVRWNPNMVDLTNYYLHLGVTGGLPLMLCLMAFLAVAFRLLTRRMNELRATGSADEFVLWCAGVSLTTHAVAFISISYFDQMYIFFYLLLGVIPGLVSSPSSISKLSRAQQSAEPAPPQLLRYYS